ncbi:MAG: dTMP kinase [Alphaproteobacteria bacterium]|nr:dTMP kinase [Alphaproteobacteria bacterium]
MTGKFITFEGGEGTGKSTQARLLASHLEQSGMQVVLTREPGGAPGAEVIRDLLVNGEPDRWSPMAEALLFNAARVEHWRQCIEPALKSGTHVVCDRFADSTMAYQGYVGGLTREAMAQLHWLALGDARPDLTLILDMPAEAGLERAANRREGENRFELKGEAFHAKLREAFLDIARRESNRCVVIDAARAMDQVHSEVLTAVHTRLGI